MIKTDALVVGAGPVGLFVVQQLGLIGLKAEVVDNLEFNWGQRRGKVWWIGIERTIDSEDFQAFRKRKLP